MEERKLTLIPNSTQIPNVIMDFILPRIPEAEARCLLYVCRRTFGFHKESDRISFSQFIQGMKDKSGKVLDHGTGLSRQSVSEGLKNLVKAEVLVMTETTKGNWYRINLEMDIEKVVYLVDQSRGYTRSGLPTRPKVVKLVDTQKKGNSEKQSICGSTDPPKMNAYEEVVSFWREYVPKTRRISAIVTKADRSNLVRIMRDYRIPRETLEQVMLYFLAHYRKFTPSLSTMFSAGCLSMLLNDMENSRDFWKNLTAYADQYMRPKIEVENQKSIITEMQQLCVAMKINS